MTDKTIKRLEALEAEAGAGSDRPIAVEHYDIGEDGELIRLLDPSGTPDDSRPAKMIIKVIYVDSGQQGGPGPRYLAYQRRLQGVIVGGGSDGDTLKRPLG